LRIENTSRSTGVGKSSNAASRTSGGFFIDEGTGTARAAAAQPMVQTSSIDALLAMQAAEDPQFAKKKAVRRGNSLLDLLERIKADMLLGQVSEDRLGQLMDLIGEARQRNMPGLDAVLDDIELRARVELAKFGHFPPG
jgi:parvulin-like peptidyl-prolyl isomerase